MIRKSCKNCIYLFKVQNAAGLFICTNKHNAPGLLFVLKEDRTCRNFRQPSVSQRPRIRQPTNGDTRFIPLTQGRFAIVDASDYDWLSTFKWNAWVWKKWSYAGCYLNRRNMSMHRLIMNPPPDMVVDHIDHNGLNNKRNNLRICTPRQNAFNRKGKGTASKYKGIRWNKKTNKWVAQIKYYDRAMQIGSFDSQIAAAKAYDQMARKLFKEFAYLNFPTEPRPSGSG